MEKTNTVEKKNAIRRTKIEGPNGVSTALMSFPIMLLGENVMNR